MRVGLTALLTDRVPNVQTIKRLVARSGAASERNDRREPVYGVEEAAEAARNHAREALG